MPANEALTQLIQAVVQEWSRADYYEAHELLEDVAECLEDNDEDYEIALALVHLAACCHKMMHDVGRAAVPGKIDRALPKIEEAVPDWMGLDLKSFREQMVRFRKQTEAFISVSYTHLTLPTTPYV